MRLILFFILVANLAYVVGWKGVREKEVSAVSVILILMLLVPVGFTELRWQVLQAKGTEVVKEVSQIRTAHLYCQRASEAFFDSHPARFGEVNYDKPEEAWVATGSCQAVFDYMLSPNKSNPPLNQIIGIHVLVHEAGHIGGNKDEASTECSAMQKFTLAAVKLGATPDEARSMVDRYYNEVYKLNADDRYTSPDCVNGGKMDLNPKSDVFP